MVLDFGILGTQDKTIQTSDYRTAGSHQAENLLYAATAAAGTWVEITTVTEGKTLYVSSIIISPDSGNVTLAYLGTGAAGSEAIFMKLKMPVDENTVINLQSPIKFSSGTRIAGKNNILASTHFTLIGWEE